ncbi:MAG: hypothetical protein K8L97_25715 [Anaerolineae bacterium]|nr:hypothetical protein [Anaerolineae bacterium]
MRITQLLGMAHYEFLMQWRRGALRLILVMFVLAPLLAMFLILASTQQLDLSATQWSDAYSAEFRFTSMAILMVLPLAPLVFIALPILVADSLPLDRHFGVRDLLDTLALERRVYLLGKVLGVWCGLLLTLVVAAVGLGIVFRFMHGPFSLRVWALLWVVGVAPMTLITSGVGLLFPAGYATRRLAVMTVFACIPIFVHLFSTSPLMQFLMASVTPESALIQNDSGAIIGVVGITLEFVVSMVLGCLLVLLIAGGWAWNWLRTQDVKR